MPGFEARMSDPALFRCARCGDLHSQRFWDSYMGETVALCEDCAVCLNGEVFGPDTGSVDVGATVAPAVTWHVEWSRPSGRE